MRLGDCAGNLVLPPADVRVAVGAAIDLHMTEDGSPPRPIDPLPTAADGDVVRLVARDGGGALGRYLAVSEGQAILWTSGVCYDPAMGQQRTGLCPVLRVVVGP